MMVYPTQTANNIPVLYYSDICGQKALKTALEIAYITAVNGPKIGVLISGERGTGKSTVVRSFSKMMYGDLPVTLPINATEDRVVGGWNIEKIMAGEAKPMDGILVKANGRILYIDEVNLLDDHIVNIILDTAGDGILSVQRQGIDIPATQTKFILVGTMNPDEGPLRPQLLDRFGLMVSVTTEPAERANILNTVLAFDRKLAQFEKDPEKVSEYDSGHQTQADREQLEWAADNLAKAEIKKPVIDKCVELAEAFDVVGHRADHVLALAARAIAVRKAAKTKTSGNIEVSVKHLGRVARMALEHRRKVSSDWSENDTRKVRKILGLTEELIL